MWPYRMRFRGAAAVLACDKYSHQFFVDDHENSQTARHATIATHASETASVSHVAMEENATATGVPKAPARPAERWAIRPALKYGAGLPRWRAYSTESVTRLDNTLK